MDNKKIKYRDIMNLGFTEQICTDQVYFDQFGFDYCHITKDLTKKIYLDWEKETQLCKMVRVDTQKDDGVIKKQMAIRNIDHLREIVDFFSDENPEYKYSNTYYEKIYA